MGVILVALAVLAGPGLFAGGGALTPVGDAMFLAAGPMWATFAVLCKRRGAGPLEATAVVSVLSGAALVAATAGFDRIPALPAPALAAQVVVQGVLSDVVAVLAFATAVRAPGASRAAALPAMLPGTATRIGIPVAGEVPNALQAAGLLLVVAGLTLAACLAGRRRGAKGASPCPSRSRRVLGADPACNLPPGRGEQDAKQAVVGMAGGAAVAIVCKTPGVGGGKSRLRPLLGAERVADLSACFIRDIAATLDGLAPAVGGSRIAIYSPAGSEEALRPLLTPHWRLFFQQAATIGEVLHASLSAFLAEGHDCALVVNADSPTLPGRVVEQAVAALREPGERAVFGPASDGGYYLVGLKRPRAELFEGVAWSTPAVLAQSLERAAAIGLPVALLPTWYDVDDAETLGVLRAELAGAPPAFAEPGLAGADPRHTRALLSKSLAPGPAAALAAGAA